MQRFCLTLALQNDEKRIAAYDEKHRLVWPAVLATLREAGVLDMQIYRHGTQFFMILEADDQFTFERKAALDRANPVVMQWEREMAEFQSANPNPNPNADADASGKWLPMQKIFDLAEQAGTMRRDA